MRNRYSIATRNKRPWRTRQVQGIICSWILRVSLSHRFVRLRTREIQGPTSPLPRPCVSARPWSCISNTGNAQRDLNVRYDRRTAASGTVSHRQKRKQAFKQVSKPGRRSQADTLCECSYSSDLSLPQPAMTYQVVQGVPCHLSGLCCITSDPLATGLKHASACRRAWHARAGSTFLPGDHLPGIVDLLGQAQGGCSTRCLRFHLVSLVRSRNKVLSTCMSDSIRVWLWPDGLTLGCGSRRGRRAHPPAASVAPVRMPAAPLQGAADRQLAAVCGPADAQEQWGTCGFPWAQWRVPKGHASQARRARFAPRERRRVAG